jgi:uncharacterized membrane protein
MKRVRLVLLSVMAAALLASAAPARAIGNHETCWDWGQCYGVCLSWGNYCCDQICFDCDGNPMGWLHDPWCNESDYM